MFGIFLGDAKVKRDTEIHPHKGGKEALIGRWHTLETRPASMVDISSKTLFFASVFRHDVHTGQW